MDQNTMWTVIGFGLAAISFLLNLFLGGRKSHLQAKLSAVEKECSVLKTRQGEQESRLTKLREYAKGTQVIQPRYLDVLLLGPRGSGKTVLSELWRAPFTEIADVEVTQDVWVQHDIAVYEGEEFSGHDDLFEVNRTYLRQYRLRILDYAGDDRYKREALEALQTKSQTALVLFFPCIHVRDMDTIVSSSSLEEACQRNRDYFSSHFLNQLATLPRLGKNVARTFVVFSRIDQLPQAEITKVEQLHEQSLAQLRLTFGSERVNVWHISARTNANTFNLLGSITKLFFDGAALPRILQERFEGAAHLAYDFKRES